MSEEKLIGLIITIFLILVGLIAWGVRYFTAHVVKGLNDTKSDFMGQIKTMHSDMTSRFDRICKAVFGLENTTRSIQIEFAKHGVRLENVEEKAELANKRISEKCM